MTGRLFHDSMIVQSSASNGRPRLLQPGNTVDERFLIRGRFAARFCCCNHGSLVRSPDTLWNGILNSACFASGCTCPQVGVHRHSTGLVGATCGIGCLVTLCCIPDVSHLTVCVLRHAAHRHQSAMGNTVHRHRLCFQSRYCLASGLIQVCVH